MYKRYIKRLLDFIISLLLLLLLWWVILIIYVILSFANKGAGAFFFQDRPGKDEKVFKLIKFKSMTDEKGADGLLLPDQQRLTKVGRLIRTTSLDELPQLINVLKGDMSLIGPRPLLIRYLPYYSDRERLRHSVRPGITGWAQVHGRNLISWDDKLELDVYYAENVSFLLDFRIFCMTVYKVIKHEGVIADKAEHYLDVERESIINTK